jgi:lipoprotein-anchoring transpeptidase ErfK/SrfK
MVAAGVATGFALSGVAAASPMPTPPATPVETPPAAPSVAAPAASAATPPAAAAATPAVPAATIAPSPRAGTGELSPASLNAPGLTKVVTSRSKGAATLRAQILLDRARFSPGEIDASYGSNMRRAVAGFQASNGIQASGNVDAATWAALDRDTAPVLVAYTLTEADVAGPFAPIPADMMEKSKMPSLGYTSVLELLGEKFHASPKLLQQLNPGQDFAKSGQQINVPSVEPATPMPAIAKLVIDKSEFTVSLLDASDKVVAQYPASTGSEHDPLPIGVWKIQGVSSNPTFNYNPALFWDANPTHSKAKIPAGPNNPVGVVWVDLSKEHYGIHGTPEPSKIGKTESHGCIRMTNWSALAMSAAVKPGMSAVLQE